MHKMSRPNSEFHVLEEVGGGRKASETTHLLYLGRARAVTVVSSTTTYIGHHIQKEERRKTKHKPYDRWQ
jgi:hypothetical protein